MRHHPELRAIPVIVLTAMVDDENKIERSLQHQSNVKYLRKPFRLAELVNLIRQSLRSAPKNQASSKLVSKGAIRLDTKRRTLWIEDRLMATLSVKKAKLLQALLESTSAVKRS